MDYREVREGAVVCFRNRVDGEFVLISRWTREISEAYRFAHSEPYTPAKGNREPVFPDAIYESVEVPLQTVDRLKDLYGRLERKPFRTKIHDHELFMVLEERAG